MFALRKKDSWCCAEFSEATGFLVRTQTRLRARSRYRHTRATLILSGLNAFLGKKKNETVRRCAFAFVPERPRNDRSAERGTEPSSLDSPPAAAPDALPSVRKARREARPKRPNFPGEPRSAAPRPQLCRAPAPRGAPAAPPPRRFLSAPAQSCRRRLSFSPRRGRRGAPETPAPPRPGCGAPPPRRARSRSCARGRPVPTRPALLPGGAGTAAARRGTHRFSQGLSPALPSASALGTPRLHPLGGRSSLSLSVSLSPLCPTLGSLWSALSAGPGGGADSRRRTSLRAGGPLRLRPPLCSRRR